MFVNWIVTHVILCFMIFGCFLDIEIFKHFCSFILRVLGH